MSDDGDQLQKEDTMAGAGLAEEIPAEDQALLDEMAASDAVDRVEAAKERGQPPEPTEIPGEGADDTGAEATGQQPPPEEGAAGDDDAANKQVPLAALHQSREAEKQAKTRASDLEKRMEIMNERFGRIMDEVVTPYAQGIQQQQNPPDTPPEPAKPPVTYEEDPLAFLQWKTDQQAQEIQQLNGYAAEQGKATQAQAQVSAVLSDYNRDAEAYEAQNPGFRAAYDKLIASRDAELELAGVSDPNARRAYMNQEEFALIVNARRAGQNPAAAFHAMAKHRGLVADPNVVPPAADPPPAANGEAAAPSAAEEKMTTLERGQTATNPGAAGSTGETPRPLDLVAISRMTDEEFEAGLGGDDPAKRDALWQKALGNS